MRTWTEGSSLVVALDGRLDAVNSGEAGAYIRQAMAEHPGLTLVVDAGELQFISSAGLRMLLGLSRDCGGLTLREVTPEVYDILQMTGFTSILTVVRKMREISVAGCPVIGRGAIGTVYRLDGETIVKVYEIPDCLPMIENEQRRAKQALIKGIPTAISYDIVKVGEKYGSVFELINARSFNSLLAESPERADELIRRYTGIIRQVHAIQAEPGELPDARDTYLGYTAQLGDALPPRVAAWLTGLFRAMPQDLHVIHGDFHMNNIMLSDGEALLIDMDTLSVGNPVFDFAGIFVAYRAFNLDEPGNSMAFLGIPEAVSRAVYEETLANYLSREGSPVPEEALAAARNKVETVGLVRFLYLLLVLKLGGEPALRERRIRRAVERLTALCDQGLVQDLTL